MTRSRVGSKYPMRMDMAFSPVDAVCLKGTGHNILLGRANPTNGIFGNHRSEDTPLRRSLPRAQCDERIEYHAVDFQARAECALARAKCPLGRNADVVDAGPPWRRLDALDQLRYLPLECVGWPKEVGPEGDEQIAVVALGIRARTGEQSQRLDHERKPETFVAAERQQGAASGRRWIPGRLAPRAERDAFGK